MSRQTCKMSVGFIAVVALVLVVGMAAAAQAVTMVTQNATVACSSSDLLQTEFSSVAITFGPGGDVGINEGVREPLFRNGIAIPSLGPNPSWQDPDHLVMGGGNGGGQGWGMKNGGYLVYTLNTTVNTLGYDLSEIDMFHGWQDDGRDKSGISVTYSTVAAPTTFISLYSNASYDPPDQYGETSIVVGLGEATGVKAVRIDFYGIAGSPSGVGGGQENSWSGVSEIDVVGAATVIPEPATLALLAIGGVGMLIRRRNRKS